MTAKISPNNYRMYCIRDIYGNKIVKTGARWIMETFKPLPLTLLGERMEVDHINGDTTDDNIDNLQWITHKDNMRKRRYNKRGTYKLPVYCFHDDDTIEKFMCRKDIDFVSEYTLTHLLSDSPTSRYDNHHSKKYKCSMYHYH